MGDSNRIILSTLAGVIINRLPKSLLSPGIKTVLILFFASLLAGCHTGHKLSRLIPSGASLEKLADGFSFTEGPAADADGNVYFTDQPNDRILKWSTEGQLSVFLQPSGRSNGMYFDPEGYLWTCADENNSFWRINPDKSYTVIVPEYTGNSLNGPNDLWIRPDGGIYFTDPYYQRPWWSHTTMPQECQGVYFFNPLDGKVLRVISDLVKPNGIVGSADGKRLYVADIGGNKTWRYTIKPDGSLSDKTHFCSLGSDGMTIDSSGNLYLTGKGVTIFNRRGRLVGNIPVPENWTANVCFGDADRKGLYITASKGLYRIRLERGQ